MLCYVTLDNLFTILPLNFILHLSKNLLTFFFSRRPFGDHFLPFPLLQIMTPISYPSIHTRILFFTFLHLALCSRNNKYCIRHLFILNSSLHKQPFITAHFRSSLHIFVHHCTFCASLHTKTSPALRY